MTRDETETVIRFDDKETQERAKVPAWFRLPKESTRAYELFCVYLDMGPSERSVMKVSKKCHKYYTYIGRLSSKFKWVERAKAYDDYINEEVRKRVREDLIETRRRHADMARDFQRTITLPLQELLSRLTDKEKQRELYDNLSKMKLEDLIAMVKASVKDWQIAVNVERLSLGLTTEDIGVVNKEELKKEVEKELLEDYREWAREREN